MRFQKQQGHQFHGHPASFVNTSFEWECLGSLTRARLMNRGQSNKRYFVPHHRGILSHIRSQTTITNQPNLQRTGFYSHVPLPAPAAPYGSEAGDLICLGYRRGNTCLRSCLFSNQLQVPGGQLVVRHVCCDQVKAEEEGCVIGGLRMFRSVGTSGSRDTWAPFSNCSLNWGFCCSWVFTRLGPGNCQPAFTVWPDARAASGGSWVGGQGHIAFGLLFSGPGGSQAEATSACLFVGIEGGCGKRRQEVVRRQSDIFHKWMKFSFTGTIPGSWYTFLKTLRLCLLYFLNWFLLAYSWFRVLVSGVQQSESVLYIYMYICIHTYTYIHSLLDSFPI